MGFSLPIYAPQLCADPRAERPQRNARAIAERVALWRLAVQRLRRPKLRAAGALYARRSYVPRWGLVGRAWRSSAAWRCPLTQCRYNLAEFGEESMAPGCAMLVIVPGLTRSPKWVSNWIGLTRQRADQIEKSALRRKSLSALRHFHEAGVGEDVSPLDAAVAYLRESGEALTSAVGHHLGRSRDYAGRVLREAQSRGLVRVKSAGAGGWYEHTWCAT